MAPERAVGCITDEVTGKAVEGFSLRVKHLNLIGPKVRRLRHQRNWSQNDLPTSWAKAYYERGCSSYYWAVHSVGSNSSTSMGCFRFNKKS